MVNEWLLAVINEAKAQAELKVLEDRRKDIREGYKTLSPVGTQVNRKERAVGLAEDTYREVLRGLSEARLRLKNIEMSTSNLQIITPPEYPLTDNGRKRLLYIIAAFVGSVIFIIGFSLLVELIDRTLRDADRSRPYRLTGDCGFQWHQQLEIPRFSQSVQPSCSSLCLPAAQSVSQAWSVNSHQSAQYGRKRRKVVPCQILCRLLENRRPESAYRLLSHRL